MAKLYFYYAAMNAGKSTTLLQSAYNYNERGMDTLLFKPEIDTRYGTDVVASRIGLEASAISFNPELNFHEYAKQKIEENPNIKCVLIDECQFLTKEQVYQCTDIADFINTPVLAYGLRSDFMGETFEGSKYLLALADELIEIKTICHCGKKASMNMRVDENNKKVEAGAQIEIGGNDRYVATCRKHYKLGEAKEFHPEVNLQTEEA